MFELIYIKIEILKKDTHTVYAWPKINDDFNIRWIYYLSIVRVVNLLNTLKKITRIAIKARLIYDNGCFNGNMLFDEDAKLQRFLNVSLWAIFIACFLILFNRNLILSTNLNYYESSRSRVDFPSLLCCQKQFSHIDLSWRFSAMYLLRLLNLVLSPL